MNTSHDECQQHTIFFPSETDSGSKFRPRIQRKRDCSSQDNEDEDMEMDESGEHSNQDSSHDSLVNKYGVKSSIEGLRGLQSQLQFLGLLGMTESELEHIPAVKVRYQMDKSNIELLFHACAIDDNLTSSGWTPNQKVL